MSKVGKSRRNCCVWGCSNSEANVVGKQPAVKFHRFPAVSQNASRREQWIQWVKRKYIENDKDWLPTDNSRICSEHFVDNISHDSPTHSGYIPKRYPPKLLHNYPHMARRKVPKDNERWNRANKKQRVALLEEIINNYPLEEQVIEDTIPNHTESNYTNQSTQTEIFDHVRAPNGKLQAFISNINGQGEGQNREGLDELTAPNEVIDDQDLAEQICQLKARQDVLLQQLNLSDQVRVLRDLISKLEKEVDCTAKSQKLSIAVNSWTQVSHGPDTVTRGVGHDENVPYFCGFSSVEQQSAQNYKSLESLTAVKTEVFRFLCNVLKLSGFQPRVRRIEDFLLIYLMKVKHDLTFASLSVIFHLPPTTVRKNFFNVLNRLYLSTKSLIFWPKRDSVEACLPDCFRKDFPKCRAIIDCTEFRVEKPRSIIKANALYSNYKSCHTVKVLIASSPNGHICFISEAYGGRTSDAFLTNFSGFLNHLEPGDVILADKGFPVITADEVTTVIPPRKHKNTFQFTAEQLEETEKISSSRIHIERVIQRVKIFDILSNRLHHSMLPHVNKIITVCAVLVNLQNKIIRSKSTPADEDDESEKENDNEWDQESDDLLKATIFRPNENDDEINEENTCNHMQLFKYN